MTGNEGNHKGCPYQPGASLVGALITGTHCSHDQPSLSNYLKTVHKVLDPSFRRKQESS